MRLTLLFGALLGLLAVLLGATQGHDLAARLDAASLERLNTARLYHWLHAVALLALASLQQHRAVGARAGRAVARLWALGSLLFCGSLYARTFWAGWPGSLNLLTPLGGVLLLLGWAALATAAAHGLRRAQHQPPPHGR